jgi:hypothetical protein
LAFPLFKPSRRLPAQKKGPLMLTTPQIELLSIFAAFAFMAGVLTAVW